MSWFSLGLQGKQRWDSHSLFSGIVTGGIAGRLAVDKVLKKTQIYLQIRGAAASAFASPFAERLTPMSREIAVKILEHSLKEDKLSSHAAKLINQFKEVPTEDLVKIGATGILFMKNAAIRYLYHSQAENNFLIGNDLTLEKPEQEQAQIDQKASQQDGLPIQDNIIAENDSRNQVNQEQKHNRISYKQAATFVDYLFKNYSMNEVFEIVSLLKDKKFNEVSNKILIATLRPVTEQAVKATINGTIKASAAKAFDFCVMKVISIASMQILYAITSSALALMSRECPQGIVDTGLVKLVNCLPSVSTMLWISIAFHAAEVARAIWLAKRMKPQSNDLDKSGVKELAIKIAQEPIARKLQAHAIFSIFKITPDKEIVDALAKRMIQDGVDFYWNDFHEIKFLGLPLVT